MCFEELIHNLHVCIRIICAHCRHREKKDFFNGVRVALYFCANVLSIFCSSTNSLKILHLLLFSLLQLAKLMADLKNVPGIFTGKGPLAKTLVSGNYFPDPYCFSGRLNFECFFKQTNKKSSLQRSLIGVIKLTPIYFTT